jgi:hypothetical protein
LLTNSRLSQEEKRVLGRFLAVPVRMGGFERLMLERENQGGDEGQAEILCSQGHITKAPKGETLGA